MQQSDTNLHTADEHHDLNEKAPLNADSLSKSKLHLIIMIIEAVIIAGLLIAVIVLAVKKDDDDDDDINGNNNNGDNTNDDSDDEYVEENFDWTEEYNKAKALLSSFTLREKKLLTYSTENMYGACVGSIDPNINKGFPGICLQDGPAGVRFSNYTTSWQAAINTAATFNRTLMYEVGAAQGKEFYDKGVTIMLAPCVNYLRNPTGGRVWEGFGEDPFLTSEAGVQLVKGIQSQNVLACIKHFIGNEIEDPRHNSSSNIPEQALWEIYLEPFYKAVKKADVTSVMESYNAVDDIFMTRNKRLLQDILKDKIGFKGFIMSDWWSINNPSHENFGNGCDMHMPGGPGWTPNATGEEGSDWNNIPEWINSGLITMDRLDDATTRIVAAMYRVNQIPAKVTSENSYPNNVKLDTNTYTDSNIAKNRQAGRESIVLLKNKDNFLPLRKNQINPHDFKSIAIIGNNAAYSDCAGIYKNDVTCGDPGNQALRFFRGYTALGWGSGTTFFQYQVAPFDAINATAVYFGWTVTYSTGSIGDYLNDDNQTYTRRDIIEVLDFNESVCQNADVTLAFIGANSGEEYINVEGLAGDRVNLDPWHNGTQLVENVLSRCANSSKIVLVVLGPATVNIRQWIHNDQIEAILFGGMLGGQGGNALVDILFGDYSPSGHLPYVWAPLESYPNVTKVNYTTSDEYIYREYTYVEDVFIGQRYVDKNNKSYDFPFGFGLSYSTFKYSDLNVKMRRKGLTVKFKVKNTGKYDASVVPMVFLGFPLENYPQKVLKGFDKKLLKVDEETIFSILVEPHDLSYYDVHSAAFVRPTTGEYKVYVSENARDDQLITTVSAAF